MIREWALQMLVCGSEENKLNGKRIHLQCEGAMIKSLDLSLILVILRDDQIEKGRGEFALINFFFFSSDFENFPLSMPCLATVPKSY